jgi:hypothetical protein
MHVHLVWESSDFAVSSVPLIESLKSKTHLITDAWKRKNLTHLQRVLLFKDSTALGLHFVVADGRRHSAFASHTHSWPLSVLLISIFEVELHSRESSFEQTRQLEAHSPGHRSGLRGDLPGLLSRPSVADRISAPKIDRSFLSYSFALALSPTSAPDEHCFLRFSQALLVLREYP